MSLDKEVSASRAPRRVPRPRRAAFAACVAACLVSVLPPVARAQVGEPSSDAGPPVPPDAPTGRRVVYGPTRAEATREAPVRACSFHEAVCVSGRGGDEATLLAALSHAEVALAGLRGPLRMARPDPGLLTGVFDLVLVDGELEGEIVLDERDPRSPLDRGGGYGRVSRRLDRGCALQVAVTRLVARGLLLRTAPGADEGSAQAEAQAVTELLVPCAPLRASAAYLTFQQHPERALVSRLAGESGGRFEASREPALWGLGSVDDRGGAPHALGAALFYRWLDRGYGTEPGAVLRGLIALRGQKTPPSSPRWVNEPDAFDVLEKSFAGRLFEGSKLDDLLVEFALSRARFGASAPGGVEAAGASGALGDAPPARVDWDVPWPTTPRRLGPAYPLEPTGSSYIVVHTAGAPAGARLRVEAAWEEHAKLRLGFLRVDKGGRELSRGRIASSPVAREAQMSIADLDQAERVVLVVTNVGDPSFHFDPDDVVFEPHGYALTLAPE